MNTSYIKTTRGCGSSEEVPELACGCNGTSCNKLNVQNWLKNIPVPLHQISDIVEIRFKNTRKGFYKNVNNLVLDEEDIVAVEASPGHDIGIVSLVGPLVFEQLMRYGVNLETELKKIYRKAKSTDIEKWQHAIEQEEVVMLKARKIAAELNLNMKIGDVEYQGDGTKAIFYYIADERVDFRELIKILAEEFRIRIEMKQIGARQEAGRIGGIGSCGRELCCSTWITSFVSVTTNAARYQDLSLNPQKLAGQCGKLKCCLNYEVDVYVDAQKTFPSTTLELTTSEGTAFHQKSDIFKGIMWYSYDQNSAFNLTAVSVSRVKEIAEMNKKGQKPYSLLSNDKETETRAKEKVNTGFENAVNTDSISRFDDKERPKKRVKNKNRRFRGNDNQNKSKSNE